MKILLCADNHFCQYSSIARQRGEKYSFRLENQIQTFKWVKEIAETEKVDMMVHLGDFFDKATLNAEEITALKELEWPNIPIKFLVGNHEMGSSDLSINSINVLAKVGEIIDSPKMDSGYGYELVYLPYILESERKPLAEYLDKLSKDYWKDSWTTQEVKNRIILSHNDIAGVQFGQFVSKTGFSLDEISQNCSLFVNGHLHNQQQLNDKVINLGNVTGLNFSEDATKYSHCVGILDTNTLNLKLINNPYAMQFYKFDIENESDLSCLDKCLPNSCVSVKIPEILLNLTKEKISANDSIISHKISLLPNLTHSTPKNIQEIVKVDHIQQFKNYIIDTLGQSEILLGELSLL